MPIEIRKPQRTTTKVGGIGLDDWLAGASRDNADTSSVALGGAVRSIHDRSRFTASKRHWFRETDVGRVGACGADQCASGRGNLIHFQETERSTESRYFNERDDLG